MDAEGETLDQHAEISLLLMPEDREKKKHMLIKDDLLNNKTLKNI